MKILYIVPYVPNLVRVRPFNLIRALSEQGHQVTVATLWATAAEHADVRALARHCHQVIDFPLPRWRSIWNSLKVLPTGTPLQSAYCWQPALAAWLDEALAPDAPGFDVIHIEHLRGVVYGLYLQEGMAAGRLRRRPIVWDAVDCISHLFRQAVAQRPGRLGRWLTRLELGRTERYESNLLHQFDRILVTSQADETALRALNGKSETAPLTIVANGVDLDYFTPAPGARTTTPTLVVSGKMSYHANVSMCLNLLENIMPKVWAQRPDVQVWLVGKDPPREVLAWGERPGIEVTGTVADIRPYLRQATMAVAPITYGAGIQNKVLEAMACATPVVASNLAVGALAAAPGRDLLVAAAPTPFAEAVLSLVDNPKQQRQLGEAGLNYVRTHHHWAAIATTLEKVYDQVIEQHPDRPTSRSSHPSRHPALIS